jgi:hypothetical protein
MAAEYPEQLEKRKRGRPPGVNTPLKMTTDVRAEYCRLVAAGHRPTEAARLVGVSYATIQRHVKADPGFALDVQAAEEIAVEPIERKLYEMAEGGHHDSIKFVLKNRAKDRWSDSTRTEVNHTGSVGLTAGTVGDQITEILARLQERAALELEDPSIVDAIIIVDDIIADTGE